MKHLIRPYKKSDLATVQGWARSHFDYAVPDTIFVENGTFILELSDIPALTMTVLMTQSRDYCYLETFMKNPQYKQSLEEYGELLVKHCFEFAKEQGFSGLICFSNKDKLTDKYQRLGMKKNIPVMSFYKVLE